MHFLSLLAGQILERWHAAELSINSDSDTADTFFCAGNIHLSLLT